MTAAALIGRVVRYAAVTGAQAAGIVDALSAS